MSEFSIGAGLKNARTESGYSVKEISDYLISKGFKASPNTIYSWENGNSQPTPDALLLLCKRYSINNPTEYFIEGSQPQNVPQVPSTQPPHYADLLDEYKAIVDVTSEQAYKAQTLAFKAALVSMKEDNLDIAPDNVIPFRLSDQPASAGHGFDLGPENFHNIYVRKDCLPHNASFGVPVAGDSMEPKYHDGDILIVDGQPVDQGEIGVFTLNGDGYVKQLGNRKLISLNSDYDPIPVHDYDQFKHNGRVIGVLDPDCIVE